MCICVFAFVHILVCSCPCMCENMGVCACARVHARARARVHARARVCLPMCLCVCTYIPSAWRKCVSYVQACTCVCVCVHSIVGVCSAIGSRDTIWPDHRSFMGRVWVPRSTWRSSQVARWLSQTGHSSRHATGHRPQATGHRPQATVYAGLRSVNFIG